MASHHRALAWLIQRRLEEGSARIEEERAAYRTAPGWVSAKGGI
jgi:hypothetical protein